MKYRIVSIVFLIFLAALSRLLPHPPNFTPIAAIALFGGATFVDKRLAFAIPLLALISSDFLLGGHSTAPVVYGTFIAIVGLGLALKRYTGWVSKAVFSLFASSLFFLTTNFAVWALGEYYPRTWEGLITCFVAAVPFFHNTVLGDALYVGLLFGALHMAENHKKLFAPRHLS